MSLDRGRFLAALGALLVAPAIPAAAAPVVRYKQAAILDAAIPAVPVTLEQFFRAALGNVPGAENVAFVVRPPLDRWGRNLQLAWQATDEVDGERRAFADALDFDILDFAGDTDAACEVLRQNAKSLGAQARRVLEAQSIVPLDHGLVFNERLAELKGANRDLGVLSSNGLV